MAKLEKEALNQLSLGRGYVLNRAPYISHMLLNLTPYIVDNKIKTADGQRITMGVTSGMVLYVNGEWLMTDPEVAPDPLGKNDEVVGACLYHECEHILRGMYRLDALPNKELANIAGDEAINFNLREEGWNLPSWVVYPEKFGHPPGLTLEQYYRLLSEQVANSNKTLEQFMNGCMSGGSGVKSTSSGSGGTDKASGWQKKVGAGVCGSAGGSSISKELEKELDSVEGKSSVEVDATRRVTLDKIEEHMEQKGRGTMPGRFHDLLKTRLKKPDVDWRRELRRALLRATGRDIAGAMDYSGMHPSIGGALVGVHTSGLIDREVRICIIEDTSGSMGSSQLQQARNEGYHLLKRIGLQEAWLIQADVTVHRSQRVRLRTLPSIAFSGRGGTDFRLALKAAAALRPRPNLVVYFTDGDGVSPTKPPSGITVIWCVVRTPRARRPASWGRVVVCDSSQELMEPYEHD